MSREEGSEHLDAIEVRLREASLDGRAVEDQPDLSLLMRRARREVGLRDVVSFGFVHMLTTMLALVATVFNRVQARPAPPKPAPPAVSDRGEGQP
ncbi:MAG: hypothetical protein KDI31_14050 [Pseudomonadales bacterium]|nr:hypothetical protein [Pseudomonadales bacterium]